MAVLVVAAFAGVGLLVGGTRSAQAQYDVDCANPTAVYDETNMPTSLSLTAADVVVLSSGTFTGPVDNSGGIICVDTSAAFDPSSINGTTQLFVRGEATLPPLAAGTGASLDNEGMVTVLAQANINGFADIINRPGATLIVQSSLSFGAGVTVTNDATIEITGSVNFGGSVTNNADLTIGGGFVLTGSATNNGTMTVGGQTIIDSGGTLTNLCRFTTDGMISNDTIVNAGVIDLGDGDFLHNGAADMTQTATGVMLGRNFTNTGTITGAGQFRFGVEDAAGNIVGGVTSNQGVFAGDSAAAPIVFEDLTPTGDQILDLELGTITNVIRAPVATPGPDECGLLPPTTTTSSTSTSTSTSTTSTSTTSTSTTSTTLPPTTSTTDPSTLPLPPTTDPSTATGGVVAPPSGSDPGTGGTLPRTGAREVPRLVVTGLLLVVTGAVLGRAAARRRDG